MLNAEYILSIVKGYTNKNNEIDEDTLLDLLEGLEEPEVNDVLAILKNNNITVIEDATEPVEQFHIYTKLQKLTNEELCVLYQRGDRAALDALCVNNARLVHKIAIRVMKEYRPEVLTEEDLYIEGNLGLVKAADMFKVEMENKFSTYACWWIRQSITREVMNNGYGMRLPVHMFEQVILVNRCRNALKGGTLIELVDMLNNNYGKAYTSEQVSKLLVYADKYLSTTSLNKVVGENEGDTELIEFIVDDYSVEDEAMDTILHEEIEMVLDTLTERESDIIHLRYGLDGGIPMTLEQVGKKYNVTRERIRQIEAKALRKLRHPSRSKRLEGMLIA